MANSFLSWLDEQSKPKTSQTYWPKDMYNTKRKSSADSSYKWETANLKSVPKAYGKTYNDKFDNILGAAGVDKNEIQNFRKWLDAKEYNNYDVGATYQQNEMKNENYLHSKMDMPLNVPEAASKKETSKKTKQNGFLSDILTPLKRFEQAVNPFDNVSIKQAMKGNVKDAMTSKRSPITQELNRAGAQVTNAATFDALKNTFQRTGGDPNKDFFNQRQGVGKFADLGYELAGSALPFGALYKGIRGAGLGLKEGSKGAEKILQLQKEGALAGLGFSGAQAGLGYAINPQNQDGKETLKSVVLNTALGGLADPALYGLGKLAKPVLERLGTGKSVKQIADELKVPENKIQQVADLPEVQRNINETAAGSQFENISAMKGNGGPLKRVDSIKTFENPKEEKFVLSQDKKPFDWRRKLNQAYQNTFDSQKMLAGISNETKVKASNARQTQGITDFIAEHGLVNQKGEKIGESLKDLVKQIPLSKEKDFWRYMGHQHNIARSKEGKNVFSQFDSVSSEKKAQELLKQHPEFKETGKKVTKWINDFMDTWAKDTVGEEKLKMWQELYPDYFPIYRDMDPLKQTSFNNAKRGFVNHNNTIKKAKGAKADLSSNIKDPTGNIVQLVNKVVKAHMNNEVGKSILDEVRKGDLNDLFEVVNTKKNPLEAISNLKNEGIEGVMDNLTSQFDDVFKQVEKGNNIVKVMENGNEVHLKVKDIDYLKALQSLSDGTGKSAAEQFEKAARRVSRPIKELITSKNPLFAIFNVIKDTPTAFIQGTEHNPIKFANNYMSALHAISHNTKDFQEFVAQGGMQSGFFKNDILKMTNKLKNQKASPFESMIKKVELFNNLTEVTPRYMEYKATLEKGGTRAQGIYNAAEVTTNFARSGKWGKFFDSFILYLNPALQGLDKFVRQSWNKPLQTAIKAGGIVTIPQVATDLVNKGNPNYKAMDQRLKDDFFLIPNKFGAKDKDGNAETFFRVPKSREYSLIFAVLANRVIEMSRGKSFKEARKGVLGSLDRNFSVPTRPIWAPFTDVSRNKDWKNAPINPMGMDLDNRSNYLKYDERTSEIGKVLAKMLNRQPVDGAKLSPKDIDYLIDSYTGIIGDALLPVATKTESVSGIPQKKFIADSVYSSQSVNDFYDNLQKLRTRAADKNILKNIPSKKITKEEEQRGKLDKISRAIGDINKLSRSTMDKEQQRNLRKDVVKLANKGNKLYRQYTQ